MAQEIRADTRVYVEGKTHRYGYELEHGVLNSEWYWEAWVEYYGSSLHLSDSRFAHGWEREQQAARISAQQAVLSLLGELVDVYS